jgi:hypothetical protein
MILTRNPFYFNVVHPNAFVTKVDFTLVVGTGFINSITPRQTRTFTKLKAWTEANSYIDISPYIRDVYQYQPVVTALTATATVKNSGAFAVLFASIDAQPFDSLGSTLTPSAQKFVCTDGYGYYEEGQNKQSTSKILLTHDTYKADSRGYFIVPLSAVDGDSDPTINGDAVALGAVNVNSNYVKYLVIPCFNYTGNITVTFEGETINIELIEECKYPVQEVQFLNRFGVFEGIHFYKAAKESIMLKSEEFKNAYTNGVSYDVKRHQIQKLNVRSNRKITIETGFLNPNYNDTIGELLRSEKVYLNGSPVNVDTGSLDFKTRIVDKLISYSLNFKYAFDDINNV